VCLLRMTGTRCQLTWQCSLLPPSASSKTLNLCSIHHNMAPAALTSVPGWHWPDEPCSLSQPHRLCRDVWLRLPRQRLAGTAIWSCQAVQQFLHKL